MLGENAHAVCKLKNNGGELKDNLSRYIRRIEAGEPGAG